MKVYIANGLIIVSIVIMILYAVRKNNNFLNISKIVVDHFKIFNGANKHIIVIYVLPAFVATGIALKQSFNSSLIEAILVVISVVISALLAFQGAIMNINRKNEDEKFNDILAETNSSINFTVLINIVLVFFMLIYVGINNDLVKSIFTGIISYILLISFLTILIIMKRLRVLFEKRN